MGGEAIDSARQPNAVLEELSHGEGDAAKRVFDRSFNLEQVDDDGRVTLLALSLFVPSASRSALAEVAGFGDDMGRLDRAVQQLAELWLIDTTEGNERVRVQGLTRELAKARLAKDERVGNYQRQFINHFLQYTLAYAGRKTENFEALEAEKDNILGATDLAYGLGDWDSVAKFAYGIAIPAGGWLNVRGYWTDALRANEQALEAARRSASAVDISNFAHNLGLVHQDLGNHDTAQLLYQESLELARKLADEGSIAISLHQLATLAQNDERFDEAKILYNQSLELERKANNQNGVARSLHQLGTLAHRQLDLSEARKLYTESLEIFKKEGDQIAVASSLHQLGALAFQEGKYDEARTLYQESLEIATSSGYQSSRALTLGLMALLAEKEAKKKEAIKLFREALDILERLRSPKTDYVRQHLKRLTGK